MGTFRMYDGPDAPTYTVTTPATATAPATGTFECKLSIKCTTKKVPLCVSAGYFQLTVIRGDAKKNYADSGYVTVVDPNFRLTEGDGEQDFTIKVKNVDLAAGDKVEFIYFPRIQASSGNSGYTRAFCTWKMDAVDDSGIKLK